VFARHPRGRAKSTNTNKYLANRNLVPNIALRRLIQDHVAQAEVAQAEAAAAPPGKRGAKRGRKPAAKPAAGASKASAAASQAPAPAARKRRARTAAPAPLTPIVEVAGRRTRAQATAAART